MQIRPANSNDLVHADHLTELINRVYDVDEAGIWEPGYLRTSKAYITELITSGGLILGIVDQEVIACVQLNMNDAEGYFGMLVTDPNRRGRGAGRKMVEFIEGSALANGCRRMGMHLLDPVGWNHPMKEQLKSWYTRMDYQLEREVPFREAHPELAGNMITDCTVFYYSKELS